jgi:putative endonuclease
MLSLRQKRRMKPGWVYIMTNAPRGTLYIGVTADIGARVHQHRSGEGSAFCKRYGLTKLVYVEPYPRIDEAIAREKAMKVWRRRWKTRLIEQANPAWDDLYDQIV